MPLFHPSPPMQAFGRTRTLFEPGLGGVVSLEPQPFLQSCKAAPRSQWVTVKALRYRSSDGLEGLRLLWRRFEGKGAMSERDPFPVASSPETTPPGSGSRHLRITQKSFC